MPITATITSAPYNCPTNGTSNSQPAFVAFKADAQGLDANLTVPVHTYFFGGTGVNADDYLTGGIPTFVGEMTGATLTDSGGGGDFHFGTGQALIADDANSVRIATVSAGSRTVSLLDDSKHTLFTVGNYAVVTGFDLQGEWQNPFGYPPNPHFFDFVKIASKQTSVSPYTVTFETALTNTYKSTWPNFNSGSGGQIDNGGPATLYALPAGWNTAQDIRGPTITKTGLTRKATKADGRSVTFRDTTVTNVDGIIPSQNITHSWIGGDYSACDIEADKLVGTMAVSGGCTIGSLDFQSSSIDLLTVDDSTITGNLLGTPKRAIVRNSSIGVLQPGPYGYGRADELTCSNSVITSMGYGAGNPGGRLYKGPSDAGIDAFFTMTNGVIRVPNTYGASVVNWAVEGTYVWFTDLDRACLSMFRVTDVTQDGTYVYVHTNQAGGFPSYSSHLWVRTHPMPRLTFRNCVASGLAGTNDNSEPWSHSQAPAGAPIYSYYNHTFNGSAQTANTQYLIGNAVSIRVTVNTAYTTGSTALSFSPCGDVAAGACYLTRADGSTYRYGPTINARIAGTRLMTIANGVATITGTQSGDSFTAGPDIPMWFANIANGFFSRDISGESQTGWPSIDVEIITNQGVVSQNVAPLRLRLHS